MCEFIRYFGVDMAGTHAHISRRHRYQVEREKKTTNRMRFRPEISLTDLIVCEALNILSVFMLECVRVFLILLPPPFYPHKHKQHTFLWWRGANTHRNIFYSDHEVIDIFLSITLSPSLPHSVRECWVLC